jgi:hypothetical protein
VLYPACTDFLCTAPPTHTHGPQIELLLDPAGAELAIAAAAESSSANRMTEALQVGLGDPEIRMYALARMRLPTLLAGFRAFSFAGKICGCAVLGCWHILGLSGPGWPDEAGTCLLPKLRRAPQA